MERLEIVVLPGDGIGPEVISAAEQVLETIAHRFEIPFKTTSHLIGGIAMDESGSSLPDETLTACLEADAVLLGAVGGPKWDDEQAKDRPERGLLGLRKGLDLFANLRPVRPYPDLLEASPLRPEKLAGVDLLVIRELTSGVYFGNPRERRVHDGKLEAIDTMYYSEDEIRRVAHVAFRAALERRKKVTSVDKANVLETSRLWRQVVNEVAEEYPDVELETILVDAAAMHLLTRPASFDVIVTENMFGDILTDEASVLTGSMGNLPSASLGESQNSQGYPRGLYEPIHGSAPDIAGKGIANPIGMIVSVALMLRHSFGLLQAAEAVEQAVSAVLSAGLRTADLSTQGKTLGTRAMTHAIISEINQAVQQGVGV